MRPGAAGSVTWQAERVIRGRRGPDAGERCRPARQARTSGGWRVEILYGVLPRATEPQTAIGR
jgi:hypothetical protein